jgi:hypothetical protein
MDENEPITLRFTYTPADMVDAIRLYESSTPMRSIGKIAAVLALFAAGMCAYGYLELGGGDRSSYGFEWYGLAFFLLAVVFWFDLLRPLMARLVFRMNAKIYSDPSEVTFDKDGVHAKTSTYDLTRKWEAYTRLLESKQSFLLVYGKRLYATIPKRAFTDEKQIEWFREMVKSKIGSST